MVDQKAPPAGPDLAQGVALSEFAGNTLLGHVGEEEVLLVRSGSEIFAIDAHCSHYHGPLAEGLVTGEGIRCPWHHACFDLRTGEAVRAPALDRLRSGRSSAMMSASFQRKARTTQTECEEPSKRPANRDRWRRRGGLFRGRNAAAAGLSRQHRDAEQRGCGPCDRPNLSKDYLAGSAPEDWLPLRPDDFYAEAKIDLRLNTEVTSIDTKARNIVNFGGEAIPYDRLLLATGAEPVRLPIPGADQPHVHVLRSLADCRAIIAQADGARRAIVIGASFIGLEAAASLRAQKCRGSRRRP